jgi:hypothetical protein
VGLADRLVAASSAFLDRLDAAQRDQAMLPFDEHERRTWAYWPTSRRGLPLSSLSRDQTKAAFRLLAQLVAAPAFARAMATIALEEVLDQAEGGRSDHRHSGDYWTTVFGTPGAEPWGLRFEGHHVSVHLTVAGGQVQSTPLFLGANPAVVSDAAGVISRPLASEDRLGFELLHSLTAEQRSSAIVADVAPDDVVTGNGSRIDRLELEGVPLSALTSEAAAIAERLVELYLSRFADGVLRPEPAELRFAWAGAAEPGIGHYYRLAGPHLVVEFDNTQNGANHVHTVVRDPGADFGEDLLAGHYRVAHHPMAGDSA